MTIVTQENELINYAAIKRIAVYTGEMQDEENDSKIEVFTVLAFDFNSETEESEDMTDEAIQLGIYTNEDDCTTVLIALQESIENGKALFRMPQPDSVKAV